MRSYRKHYKDMTTGELEAIEGFTLNNVYTYTEHALDAMQRRRINKNIVSDTILSGDVIELHIKNEDVRILKRSKSAYQDSAVCVVYSIKTGNIITAYKNSFTDNHSTLQEDLYMNTINVHDVLEKYLIN